MALLTGTKKVKTAVFISGTGSNLKNLLQFSKKKKSPITISLIISDNIKAKGLHFGKIFKIQSKVYNFNRKSLTERKILFELKLLAY